MPLGSSSASGRARNRRADGALLALCYGTRPQVIKASMLVEVLGQRWGIFSIDTGQHYDYEMNALAYEQLGVRRADLCLDVGSSDHAEQTAAILSRAALAFEHRVPWAVVVIGDTNSTLGCALAAAQRRIPVVHVEAGLRATNATMAEELNRRLVDTMSTVLCAPSPAAEQRLHQEHVHGRVECTGDVARDVMLRNIDRAVPADSLASWPLARGVPFAFVTLHRSELTDGPADLAHALAALGSLDLPVVFPTHPRTRAALERHGLIGHLPRNVHLLRAFGYIETIACVRDAEIVVTDSGGVQREAYWLGSPCVTLRGETEWAETVALGANTVLPPGRAPDELAPLVNERRRLAAGPATWDRDAYGAGDAAPRIRDAIEHWALSGSG